MGRVTIGTAGKVFSGEPGAWGNLGGKWGRSPICPTNRAPSPFSQGSIAGIIDHTLLSPTATPLDIEKLCAQAKEFSFAAVCVHPSYVRLASQALKGSQVKVVTVVGFPLGANSSLTKAIETEDALAQGADEIDMVIHLGQLKSGNSKEVFNEICSLRKLTEGRILKVIIETALLKLEEKVRASLLAKEAGADFVKTSTGFALGGATVEDIRLIRNSVGQQMGIKASGGIKTCEFARTLVSAGATRIGTSSAIDIILQEAKL